MEKAEGPSTCLSFLGIILDTTRIQAQLPHEKLQWLSQTIQEWLDRKKATEREIPSLVGSLQHATKIVQSETTFVARMYAASTKVKEMDFYIRLNQELCSDLYWWHIFLIGWNGFSLLQWSSPDTPTDVQIQTDASGSWGCGAFYNKKWLQ